MHQFNGAALVAQGDRIIYERAFGEANFEWRVPNTVDTRFDIASMTKPMTAIAIMQLVQEGKVRLDAPVSDYLPFYPRETGDRITVDQLPHSGGAARSANVYDSLGEAQLARRDTTQAIINYRKSLSLDPNNTNAAAILKRLGQL